MWDSALPAAAADGNLPSAAATHVQPARRHRYCRSSVGKETSRGRGGASVRERRKGGEAQGREESVNKRPTNFVRGSVIHKLNSNIYDHSDF